MGHEAAGGGCAAAAGAAAVAAAATGFARQHAQKQTKRLCVHDDAQGFIILVFHPLRHTCAKTTEPVCRFTFLAFQKSVPHSSVLVRPRNKGQPPCGSCGDKPCCCCLLLLLLLHMNHHSLYSITACAAPCQASFPVLWYYEARQPPLRSEVPSLRQKRVRSGTGRAHAMLRLKAIADVHNAQGVVAL